MDGEQEHTAVWACRSHLRKDRSENVEKLKKEQKNEEVYKTWGQMMVKEEKAGEAVVCAKLKIKK